MEAFHRDLLNHDHASAGEGAVELKGYSATLQIEDSAANFLLRISSSGLPSVPYNGMRSLSTLKDILTWTFILPSLASAYTLDCSDVREDRKSWNLKPLGGPRSVYRIEKHPTTFTNTTFTIDICRQLERTKGVPADEDCPSHSRGETRSLRTMAGAS